MRILPRRLDHCQDEARRRRAFPARDCRHRALLPYDDEGDLAVRGDYAGRAAPRFDPRLGPGKARDRPRGRGGVDLVRLPGRLRRVAADPRTPRRARWWLVGLAVYGEGPIDPIQDFLPGIGNPGEIVVVPLVLRKVRRMIPPVVWAEHFPPRAKS